MALKTSLSGRVKNTSLPKSHSLLPLCEAVVNAVQAVDARFEDDVSDGEVVVRILRSAQQAFDLETSGPGRVPLEPIVGFDVIDNGVGFTPANLVSFETLDSGHKAHLGCRGVGRLLWLKAFDRVEVVSRYEVQPAERADTSFTFSVSSGVEMRESTEADGEDLGSQVSLIGFRKEYQRSSPKTLPAIANDILAHCLWYFIRPGGSPKIIISDGGDSVSLNVLFDQYSLQSTDVTTIEVKGRTFELVGLRLSSGLDAYPRLCWCAASRVVIDENLSGKIPGLHGRLRSDPESPEFGYVSFLTSSYLDENVRSDRTDFDIAASSAGTLLAEELSMEDIRSVVFESIADTLKDALAISITSGKDRVDSFVRTKAPRYRSVIGRFSALGMTIDPEVNDRDLELQLHRNLQEVELDVIREGQEVLADTAMTDLNEYQAKLKSYLDKVEEIKMSDLAAYVTRRKVVLDILSKAIKLGDDGKYAKEEVVHSLLMPMRKDSNQVGPDASNLWIIDERLAFHEYLASDKTLSSMPITDSVSTKEPDLLALKMVDSPVLVSDGERIPLASIVVVEIKRPMRNDATDDDKNPISQALDYLERVREGRVTTASGRPIPQSNEVPAFCYVIADLTPNMIRRCKDAGLQLTQDATGYFGFNIARSAYVEVLSFDRLVNGATERNRAFFDKLGLPVTL